MYNFESTVYNHHLASFDAKVLHITSLPNRTYYILYKWMNKWMWSHITCEVSGSPIRNRAMQTEIVTGPLLPWSAGKKSRNVETITKIVPKSVPIPENKIHDVSQWTYLKPSSLILFKQALTSDLTLLFHNKIVAVHHLMLR